MNSQLPGDKACSFSICLGWRRPGTPSALARTWVRSIISCCITFLGTAREQTFHMRTLYLCPFAEHTSLSVKQLPFVGSPRRADIRCLRQALQWDPYPGCVIRGQPIQGQGKHHGAAAWLDRTRSCPFEPYLGTQGRYTLLFWVSTSGELVTLVTNAMWTTRRSRKPKPS
ncbi:hypothetical protein EDD16DRAFT_167972 [Pisolithus croceorrhizus]|nr:hypothetical protein EDD16DRAFT_167972 [Pisolithus croceorrhizus]KAI6116692.1 hypothetical protein EV401DRAFT_41328 [Pisolithus croceorrhizus]